MRGKNKKERLGGLLKGFAKGVDEALVSSQKVFVFVFIFLGGLFFLHMKYSKLDRMFLQQDADEFFEQEKKFLVEYHSKYEHIKGNEIKLKNSIF